MLITFEQVKYFLTMRNIPITGIFHVGAHDCEELEAYERNGVPRDSVVWVDAINSKVELAKEKGIPNIFNAVISDKDGVQVEFNVSNNFASSSILELGTHLTEHPHVFYTHKLLKNTITIDTFVKEQNIDISKLNFWNFDIQGAELLAIKGGIDSLKHVKALYLEVNEKELYKECALIGELDLYLNAFGFTRELTSMTQHGWGDALYVKRPEFL